jgi:hypothetical protein
VSSRSARWLLFLILLLLLLALHSSLSSRGEQWHEWLDQDTKDGTLGLALLVVSGSTRSLAVVSFPIIATIVVVGVVHEEEHVHFMPPVLVEIIEGVFHQGCRVVKVGMESTRAGTTIEDVNVEETNQGPKETKENGHTCTHQQAVLRHDDRDEDNHHDQKSQEKSHGRAHRMRLILGTTGSSRITGNPSPDEFRTRGFVVTDVGGCFHRSWFLIILGLDRLD